MGLSTQELARLSALLDHALPLSVEARRAWLDTLPSEDLPLVQSLRDALLSDDPDTAVGSLYRFPRSSTERRAGERLGAYELLRPLGSGGMAEVWLARRADGVFERHVALKIPRLSHVPTQMAERFARECKILATLEYPRVARLYDAGVDASGVPYIAMEYVQGEQLTAWCESRQLDVQARVQLFLQILDAVGHVHELGIIHRDLKPSNILVTKQGEARLLDFGVASLLQAGTESQSLTRMYGRALTPEYASPELLRGLPIDVRSDIYALGAVLHELLIGVRPGQQPDAEKASKLSARLRDVISTALAVAPEDRYPDTRTFAQALEESTSPARAARFPALPVRPMWAGVVALTALVALAAVYWVRSASDARTPAGQVDAIKAPVSIAVLPFVDLSERRDQGYLSDGLAEELIDLLTKVPELRVTARASSFAFRERRMEISAIARELNVDNVLEGSVRTSGERLKFTVQLVHADDATVIWSETYDRELKDIFEIQESVAGAVVDALKVRLLDAPSLSFGRRTANVRAYQEYLLGRQYRDGVSRERNEHAQAAFERAVALDPTYAPAHAGIALAAADIGFATMSTAPYDLALAASERAMSLAPHLTEAYVARANVRMGRDWNFAGAKSDLDFAMSIDPNNVELLQVYASFLWMTGKIDAALDIQRRCVARNPHASKPWDWLGRMLMDRRDYPAARTALARSAELSPYSDYRLALATLVELYSGNYDEALRMARSNPDPHFRDYTLAMAAFSAGQAEEARAAQERLIARAPEYASAQIAFTYAWQGKREQTFEWLERAVEHRDPGLFGLHYRPEFDKFRNDPKLERVLQQMRVAELTGTP